MPVALTVGPAPARPWRAVGGGRQRGARKEGGRAAEGSRVAAARGRYPAGRWGCGRALGPVELRTACPGGELGGAGGIRARGSAPRGRRRGADPPAFPVPAIPGALNSGPAPVPISTCPCRLPVFRFL